MAKITIGGEIPQDKAKFKKGDLVMLLNGKHCSETYRNRVMIVTRDEYGDGYFKAFCLIDNEEHDRCASSQFELSRKHILLSN